MLSNSFVKWLWDARRSIAVWALAISAVGALYAALWPTVNDPSFQQAIESYPEGLIEALNYDDIATPAGYLTSSVYGLLAALLLLIYATGAGARTIAGDEQAGTLELVAGHPISRRRLATERLAAMLASIVGICIAFLVVMLLVRPVADLGEISIGGFIAMHLHLVLFAALFGSIAFCIGAATGRRGLAIGLTATVAVIAYLANGLLPMIGGLESVDRASPFNWLVYDTPLRDGVQPTGALLLAIFTVLFAIAGVWAFDRRDLAI